MTYELEPAAGACIFCLELEGLAQAQKKQRNRRWRLSSQMLPPRRVLEDNREGKGRGERREPGKRERRGREGEEGEEGEEEKRRWA